jgi:hypothetical protein
MKTRYGRNLRNSALVVALFASTQWVEAGAPVTIPSTVLDAEGNSDNLYPFNGGSMRYQQVIAASEFPGGARVITKIVLRPDAISGVAFSETLSNVQINLTTTPKTPQTLSKTFADNLGNDNTVVYQGELTISSECLDVAGGSKEFDIVIKLQTPFAYDPAAGNLLLDIRNPSGIKTTQLDAHDAPDSTARVWSDDADSPTGTLNDPYPSVGLVLRFFDN